MYWNFQTRNLTAFLLESSKGRASNTHSDSLISWRRMVKEESIQQLEQPLLFSTAVQHRKLLIRKKYWCKDQTAWMTSFDIKPQGTNVFPAPQAAVSSKILKGSILWGWCFHISTFCMKQKFVLYMQDVTCPELRSLALSRSEDFHAMPWVYQVDSLHDDVHQSLTDVSAFSIWQTSAFAHTNALNTKQHQKACQFLIHLSVCQLVIYSKIFTNA